MNQDSQEAAFLKTLTVLYVEDDEAVREQGEVFLRRRVGHLVTAADGVAGLAAFSAQPVDLVVTDVRMPGMDGLTMAEAIRAQAPTVPIIVTTAFEQTDYMQRSIDLGVDRYVVKPIQSERLEAALIHCSHRLLAEEVFKQKIWLEQEAQRVKHQEAVRILMGGVAHDFNNLLQVLLTSISLAKDGLAPDSEARSLLEISDASSEQARVLAHRLHTLASGTRAPDQEGPLEALVQDVVNTGIRGTLVTAVFESTSGEAPVRYNREAMLQVIQCLTHNAVEAMPGGGRLMVSSSRCAVVAGQGLRVPEGPYLHVAFCDTGKGISPKNLSMIFEPYFSTKERGTKKGMGLGLALCDTIIRAHGGCITADSLEGKGATFHMHLPLKRPLP